MKFSVLGSLLLASFVSFAGFANDPPTTDNHDHDAAAHAAWMKYATPGEGQKRLNDLVGKFTYTAKMWMTPDAKATETKGTSTNKWLMDGRYVQSEVKGTMMGKPFTGMNIMGFDNFKSEYQTVWLDNMSTGMMWSEGTFADGVVKQMGTTPDPSTNEKARWFRTEFKVISKKEHTYTSFSKDASGKEFKMMEINYKRS